jgi:hypothetical protein
MIIDIHIAPLCRFRGGERVSCDQQTVQVCTRSNGRPETRSGRTCFDVLFRYG